MSKKRQPKIARESLFADLDQHYRDLTSNSLAEREALRKPRDNSELRRRLGDQTSGFDVFVFAFKKEIEFLRKCGIHAADQQAKVLNSKGFKSASGNVWDAELVAFARRILA